MATESLKNCSRVVHFSDFFFFFKLGLTPSKAEQPLKGMELQKKRNTKRLRHTGNLFKKTYS